MPFFASLVVGVGMLLSRLVFDFQSAVNFLDFSSRWVAYDIAGIVLAATGVVGLVVLTTIFSRRSRRQRA